MYWEALFCPSNLFTHFHYILFSACLCSNFIYQLFNPKGKKNKRRYQEPKNKWQETHVFVLLTWTVTLSFHSCPCHHMTNSTSVLFWVFPQSCLFFPTGQYKVKGFVEWQLIQIIVFSCCLFIGDASALRAEDPTCTYMPYVVHCMPAAALLSSHLLEMDVDFAHLAS